MSTQERKYKTMKTGPTVAEELDLSGDKPSLLKKLANILLTQAEPAVAIASVRSESYLRMTYETMMIKRVNRIMPEVAKLYTKAAFAVSAQRLTVTYSRASVGITDSFSVGEYGTTDNLAAILGNALSGSKTEGAVRKTYSSNETSVACRDLANAVGLRFEINHTALWAKIWHSVLADRLGRILATTNGCTASWAGRPIEPDNIVNNTRGLNVYLENLAAITSGDRLVIELNREEADLIPTFIYLLGLRNANLTMHTGANEGNNRTACLLNYNMPEFAYDIIVNQRDDLAAGYMVRPEIAGLMEGNIQGNPNYTSLSDDGLTRALRVLAKQFPHNDGIESGYVIAVGTLYAEPFNGVTQAAGSNERNTPLGYFLHGGTVVLPSGSLMTSLATSTGSLSVASQTAINTVAVLLPTFRSLAVLRDVSSTMALTLQIAARQFGISAEVVTPHNEYLIADHRRVVTPRVASVGAIRTAHLVSIPNSETNLGTMVGKMSQALYNADFPTNACCINYGHSEQRQGPYHGVANQGECLISVHPAQIPRRLFAVSAEGIAGIPANAEAMIAELDFDSDRFRAQLRMESHIGSNGGIMDNRGVVGGLGHGMTLINGTAAGNDAEDDERVSVSNRPVGTFTPDNEVLKYLHLNQARYAFATAAAMTEPPEVSKVACSQVKLFADYDIIKSTIYQMALPNNTHANRFVTDKCTRSAMVGYVNMSIAGGAVAVASLAYNVGSQVVGRVKRKANAMTNSNERNN